MKNKERSRKSISRRDFIKKSGQTILLWEGAILAGGAIMASTTSCDPDDGDNNSYK